MNFKILLGVMIPFLGTCLGAACVLPAKRELGGATHRALTGFAAGVMVAASIWSLIIPSMQESAHMGRLAFVPAVVGFWAGILFLLALDKLIPHLHMQTDTPEGPSSGMSRTLMMVFAVVLHNIPEGMAVGIVYAGWKSGATSVTLMSAFSLALGIALQNFPEGAIISLPLHAKGVSKGKALWLGVLSGAVEPIGAVITIWAASAVLSVLPYLLSFAAGAMIYVVVEELIPEMSAGRHSNLGTLCFALGFTLMMALDTALG